jgi:hypothetical protein
LDIHERTTINEFKFGDLGITTNGEGEFKLTTKEGA